MPDEKVSGVARLRHIIAIIGNTSNIGNTPCGRNHQESASLQPTRQVIEEDRVQKTLSHIDTHMCHLVLIHPYSNVYECLFRSDHVDEAKILFIVFLINVLSRHKCQFIGRHFWSSPFALLTMQYNDNSADIKM